MLAAVVFYNHRRDKGDATAMQKWEIDEIYDDYCWECEYDGIEPLPFDEWWAQWEILGY